MSLGTHIAAMAAGATDYTALPVFLSRAFRHSNIYIHANSGIVSPADLAGKRVGIGDYAQTAVIWVRGILAEDYGVSRTSVHWVSGGLHKPSRARLSLEPPAGLSLVQSGRTLDSLLASGEIDALISPIAPNCFTQAESPVIRLFDDYRVTEINYYNRTGIFPIMHCLVVRSSLLEEDSTLGGRICKAFAQSLALALGDLEKRDYAKVTLPWLVKYHKETVDWLGDPLWTYGIEPNRATLEAFLSFAAEDGLCSTSLRLTDVFAKGISAESASVAAPSARISVA